MKDINLNYAMWLLDMAIPNGECLECHYADAGRGYVKIRACGLVHRFIYSTLRKPIPEGLYVLHECDNRPCLHPNHLFVGTAKDNFDDMVNKGRYRSVNRTRLFTEEQELEMRKLQREGASYNALAAKYGVTKQTIYQYIKGGRGTYASEV